MAKKLSAYPTKNSAINSDKVVIIDGIDGLNKNFTVQTLLTEVRAEMQALVPEETFTVSDIYINSNTGDDANDGLTSGTALATHGELYRRTDNKTIFPPFKSNSYNNRIFTVHILSDLPNSDPINLNCLLGIDVNIHYKGGVKASLGTGTFTSVVPMNPATNQPLQITDTALAGTWETRLSERVRITTAGARLNTVMWVAKNLGSKQCRLSTPGILSIYEPTLLSTWGESIYFISDVYISSPQVGDSYIIEKLFSITIGSITLRGAGPGENFWYPNIAFTELEFTYANLLAIPFHNGFLYYNSIKINSLISLKEHEESVFSNCYMGYGIIAEGSILTAYINSGLVSGTNNNVGIFGGGGDIVLNIDVMCQGVSIRGTNIKIQSACVFDTVASLTSSPHGIDVGRVQANTSQEIGIPGSGITLGRNQTSSHDDNVRLWGSGNAGYGIHVQPGCMFKAGVTPTITGTLGNFALAHENTVRSFDETTGAYTTKRSATWTNIDTNIVGGGFASNAHNVSANAHLLVLADN